MLLKNFYTVLTSESLEAHSFGATVRINKEHPIFEGHFPNFPVTPGVTMLQIIKELTENQLNQSLFLSSASNVKFISLVDPNVNAILKFNITFQEDDQHIKVKNTTSFEDGTAVLKCNVTFVKR
ncbi:MAG: 3-hydroxyacyl-ACP dehydratase [Gelidibacter sp.]|uniref:3-hydroxyacyl-ACP dehydratase n=1 Tax=Gelidibacter sp. TaxID=2018083 RepID=UPI00326413F8